MRTIHKKDSPIDWIGSMPFFVMWTAGIVTPFFTGVSWSWLIVVVVLYYTRMFFVTGGLHRYFSHRQFDMNRFWQFTAALCTCTTVQNSALWWGYHHRGHHRHSDTELDLHSNWWWGFLESHFLWFLRMNSQKTDMSKIRDLAKYPELVMLDKKLICLIPPTLLAIGCYFLGGSLGESYNTNGVQMLGAFFTSTFLLHNGTFTINSLSHMYGTRRYETNEKSRNNWFLALFITLGEGWHNNHHAFPRRVRQGHTPWELDPTYGILKVLEFLGIISNLRYT